jgi:MoaA/NifB/PqqE/SkfB family radical SAM enzyme
LFVEDLELELTTICNAHCQLCYRNYKRYEKSKKVRPLQDIIEQLETFKDLKYIKLVGTESEPTLYKDFFPLIKYIKSRGLEIEICTNGDTNNEDWWRELSTLMDSGDQVFFSICGSTQKLHNTYRKGTNLKNILRNAKAFRSDNKNDYAQCIRFKYNSDDFDSKQFKDMVNQFSNVYWTETYLKQDISNYIDIENIDLLGPREDKAKEYENIEKLANLISKSDMKKETHCMSWYNKSQQIDINGDVYPCFLYLESGMKWDGDYTDIHAQKHDICKWCNTTVRKISYEKGLQYVL